MSHRISFMSTSQWMFCMSRACRQSQAIIGCFRKKLHLDRDPTFTLLWYRDMRTWASSSSRPLTEFSAKQHCIPPSFIWYELKRVRFASVFPRYKVSPSREISGWVKTQRTFFETAQVGDDDCFLDIRHEGAGCCNSTRKPQQGIFVLIKVLDTISTLVLGHLCYRKSPKSCVTFKKSSKKN